MTLTGHSETVTSVVFSPDGKLVASVSKDKSLKLWKCQTGEFLSSVPHQEKLRTVAFSPDGKIVATGCDDKIIRLFHLRELEEAKT